MNDRTYSKEEVAALLERAVALQAEQKRQVSHSEGLTLDELEVVAAETGLDPALIRQAAAEMAVQLSEEQRSGTNATHVFEERRVIAPFSQEAWDDVVAELRHRFDTDLGQSWGAPQYGKSTTHEQGRSVEWKHTSLSGIETRILVTPRGDALHVRASQRVGWGSPIAESATYGGVLAGVIAFVAGEAMTASIGLAALLVGLVTLIPLILFLDKAWRAKKHRELADLADYVTDLLTVPSPALNQVVQQEATEMTPQLDAKGWEEAPEGDSRAAGARRERSR